MSLSRLQTGTRTAIKDVAKIRACYSGKSKRINHLFSDEDSNSSNILRYNTKYFFYYSNVLRFSQNEYYICRE